MKQWLNRLLLTLYCMFALFFHPGDVGFILAFLFSVICTCASFCIEGDLYRRLINLLYCLLSIFFPVLLLFLPLLSYDFFKYKLYVSMGFSFISFLLSLAEADYMSRVFLVLGVLIAYMIWYWTSSFELLQHKHKKTRDDSTELNFLLNEKNKTLLEKQDYEIYTATLRERNRIAREIHDNVGHLLSRSILMVGAIKTTQKEPSAKNALHQLEETLSTAMNSIRTSVHDLHDESLNLQEAIHELISAFDFCPVKFQYSFEENPPRDIKYSFITIVKEAFSNIIKHSNATAVSIIMHEFPAFYQLIIEDNGTKPTAAKDKGIGLLNMQERIETLKGNIRISNAQGFRIFITVPKQTFRGEK